MARVEKSADNGPRSADEVISQLDGLDAIELGRVIQVAQERRSGKIREARDALVARVREEAALLGIRPEDLFGRPEPTRKASGNGRKRGKVSAQFRGPEGQTWSGRGRPPVWLSTLETQGRSREEFRIRAGQPDLIDQAEHAPVAA
jgi:DNA-binding protein H-NS